MKDRLVRCGSCGQMNRIDPSRVEGGMQPKCGNCKQPLSIESVITVTDSNFSQVVENSKVPVLIDFWAPWCGPCHMVSPIVEELAGELDGKIVVGKLNTDENPVTSSRFRIQGIPALLIFVNGKEADRLVGVRPKQEIAAHINRLLR
jgi:thioredoxin 2